MRIANKNSMLGVILFILILSCVCTGWSSYKLKQDVDLVNSRIEQVSLNSQIMFKNIQPSNKPSTNLQYQISEIQDFEDRRYNAITAQLNSFWSAVNGFLALIGIFFAMFSWYLVKQVESATKNIDKLEELKKNIDNYIEDKSFELYEKTIKQDITQIINMVNESKDFGAIKSAYDLLRLRINYVTIEELIHLYNSFKHNFVKAKQSNPSHYYADLSYYLVLMLFKSPKNIPDDLIREVIDLLIVSDQNVDVIQSFILLNDLCNVNQLIGKELGARTRDVIGLDKLRDDMLKNVSNDKSRVEHILTKWFGQQLAN